MNNDLRKLYSEIIKGHNENPFHFEKINNAQNTVKAYNPICGDRFDLHIDHHQNKISALHFHGFGCAISKASTSVLAKSLEGKSFPEALDICNRFLRFIDHGLKNNDLNLPEEFNAFSGVHDFPERYDCATLSWKEMKSFIVSSGTT